MKAKWLKTALLGCLAVVLIQCSPIDKAPSPLDPEGQAPTEVQHTETQTASPTIPTLNRATDTPTILATLARDDVGTRGQPEIAESALLVSVTAAYDNYPTLIPGAVPGTPGPEEQKMVALAKDQLSRKLAISLEDISIFSILAMEWPDSSLGCPLPGKHYADTAVPGYQILLEWQKTIYTFHTDTQDQVVMCRTQAPHEIYSKP